MLYRKDIQVLRGAAVLFVVLFHFRVPGFENGFLGVDIFFVISGFLMASIYKGGEWREFYYRRAKRLLPAYFVVIFITLLLGIFRLEWGEFKSLCEQVLYASGFISNIGYWAQNSYFTKADFNPLLHLWSLGVEIQFYAAFPLFFLLCRKFRCLEYIVFILSATACFLVVSVSPKTAFFMLPFRVWEFAAGYIAAGYFHQKGMPEYNGKRWLFSVAAASVLFLMPFFPLNGEALNPGYGHPGLIAMFVVVASAVFLSTGIPEKALETWPVKILEILGKYSYSIYLVHFPVLVLYFYKPFSGTNLPIPDIFDLTILCFTTLFLSWLLYQTAEQRGKSYFTFLRLVAFIALVVSAVPITTYLKQSMYEQYELNVRNAVFDRSQYRCGKLSRVLNPSAKLCQLNGRNAGKKVLLLGNSHADSLKDSFTVVADSRGYEVWFVVQNQPLMEEAGALSLNEIIDLVLQKAITNVVLHYSPGAIPLGKVQALQDELEKNGVGFAYLSPVPVWPDSVPRLLIREKGDGLVLLRKEYDDYSELNASVLNYFEGEQEEGVPFVDLGKVFCSPKCMIKSPDGKPYYFDNAHLTLTGAKVAAPSFGALFDQIEKQSLKPKVRLNTNKL